MVVYNSMDKDSFEEAKKLCMELTDRMQKPMVLLIALHAAADCAAAYLPLLWRV